MPDDWHALSWTQDSYTPYHALSTSDTHEIWKHSRTTFWCMLPNTAELAIWRKCQEHLYIPELLTTNLNHFIESDELLTSPVPLTLQTLGSKKELYHVVPHLWQSHCLKQRSHVSFRKVKTSDEILLDQKNGYEICSMTDETDIHLCSVVYWWRVVIFYTDVLHWCVGIPMYWLVSPI